VVEVPDFVNVTILVNLLTDALADLHSCNVRLGLIRQAEAERIISYQKLTGTAPR